LLQKSNLKQLVPQHSKHNPTTTKKKLEPENFATNMKQPTSKTEEESATHKNSPEK